MASTAAALAAWAVVDLSAIGSPRGRDGGSATGAHSLSVSHDHRYAILGKVRLGVFWATRDVGSARLTTQHGPESSTFALLAGSDPERAPRRLNQWFYLREERVGNRAGTLTLRSGYELDAKTDVPFAAGRGPTFSFSCASVTTASVTSALAAVEAGDITYRMFPQVLTRLPPAHAWRQHSQPHPGTAHPGFLTALGRALERDDTGVPPSNNGPEVYLFNGTLYELSVRERHALGPSTVGKQTYLKLTRSQLAIRNRATGAMTRFAVTYEPGAAVPPIPVQIFFAPSFWLKVELRLDESADAPVDPAVDPVVLERIRDICRERTAAAE